MDSVAENACTFSIYLGSTTCASAEPGQVAEQVQYGIPAGSGSLYVDLDVLDECRSQAASGVWSCG